MASTAQEETQMGDSSSNYSATARYTLVGASSGSGAAGCAPRRPRGMQLRNIRSCLMQKE